MAGLDVAALMKKMATKETKKEKKSDTPTVTIPKTEANLAAIRKFIESKKLAAQAEALQRQQEEVLLPVSEMARKAYCRDQKAFHSSVRVQVEGTEDILLLVTQQKYSVIPLKEEDALKTIFGDQFVGSFNQDTEISMTEDGVRSGAELLPLIIGAMPGKTMEAKMEAFEKNFQVTQTWTPTEKLHEGRTLDAVVDATAQKAIVQKILKPTKPSLRVP